VYTNLLENYLLTKFSRVLPNTLTISDGVVIYEQFYTPEQQNEFGVIAIEVVKVS